MDLDHEMRVAIRAEAGWHDLSGMGSEPEVAAAMRRILRRVKGAMEREREIEVAFPTELNAGFQLKTLDGSIYTGGVL